MKNQQKKSVFLVSLVVLTVTLTGSTLFFDLVGMCGNIDFLQETSWLFAALGVSTSLPRWFLFGWLSATLLVLCWYGVYRQKAHKKRYGMLVLGLFLAFWVNALFYSKSVFFLYMTLVVVGLFALANIPPAVACAATKHLATQNVPNGDTELFGRQQLRRMEWVHLFPLKRFLAGCLWMSCPIVAIMGMVANTQTPKADFVAVILLLLVISALTARKAWRYVTAPCHCVPVLNELFTKQEIEHLLLGESFAEFPLADERLQNHMPILVSENWMFVEGVMISRKLLLGGTVLQNAATVGGNFRRSSRLVFYYLDGSEIRTHNTSLYLTDEKSRVIKNALDQIAHTSIHWTCNQPLIAKKYAAILPELNDVKEKLWYLLTHDSSDLKREMVAAIASNHGVHKGKRSQMIAEKKG